MAEPSPILEQVETADAPQPTAGAPYSQAIAAGGLVFVSGQLPIDPRTGRLVDGGVEEQTRQALLNLAAVLAAADSGIDRVVKTTVYILDRSDWAAMNAVYREMVGAPAPARTALTVVALGMGALVEIDAVAVR